MHLILTILLFSFSYSESTDNLNISEERIITSYFDDGTPHIVDNYEIDKSTGNKKLIYRIEYFQDGTMDLIRFIDGGIYTITKFYFELESFFLV